VEQGLFAQKSTAREGCDEQSVVSASKSKR
jgi:hypothetical protein